MSRIAFDRPATASDINRVLDAIERMATERHRTREVDRVDRHRHFYGDGKSGLDTAAWARAVHRRPR